MTAKQSKTTRIAYIVEASFEYFVALFVTGTFLGYILDALGLSDAMQGIISTFASLTCGAQLFSILLSGRRAKRIVTIGHAINLLSFVLLYLLPIFDLSPTARTALLLILLFLGNVIKNAITPTKITWLMSAVPNKERGRFTATKEMISLAGGMIVSVALGRVADIYRSSDGLPTRTYYIICSVALLFLALVHISSLLISSEDTDRPLPERVSVGRTVKKLIKNTDLLKVSLVGIVYNIASGFSASFFVSYARSELSFTFTALTLMSVLSSLCRIVISPVLGRLADKRGFSYAMTVSFVIMAAAFLSHAFAAPGALRWLHLVYLCLSAFALGGINGGVINLIFDYVRPDERSVALGVKNAVGGILAFLSALVGGAILSLIQERGGLTLFGINLYAQQVLALISFVIIILLIVYMRLVITPLNVIDEE